MIIGQTIRAPREMLWMSVAREDASNVVEGGGCDWGVEVDIFVELFGRVRWDWGCRWC